MIQLWTFVVEVTEHSNSNSFVGSTVWMDLWSCFQNLLFMPIIWICFLLYFDILCADIILIFHFLQELVLTYYH